MVAYCVSIKPNYVDATYAAVDYLDEGRLAQFRLAARTAVLAYIVLAYI
jgi:hypothetical protein